MSKLRIFHGLLKEAGVLANKADILAGLGVDSASDLTDAQLTEVSNTLRGLIAKKNDAPVEVRRARSRILTLCTDLGVFDGRNWNRLNEYLKNPRICGKVLYELSLIELKALNRKLSHLLREKNKTVEEEQKQAINN